jgi:hypothetical protein
MITEHNIVENPLYVEGIKQCQLRASKQGLTIDETRERVNEFVQGVKLGLALSKVPLKPNITRPSPPILEN